MFKTLILISLAISSAFALLGIDIATFEGPFSLTQWQCFKNRGDLSFAVIQVWDGHSGPSTHYSADYYSAKAAGIAYVDAYTTVCKNCLNSTAESIATSVKDTLPSDFDGMLWLNVEYYFGWWDTNATFNLNFIEEVATLCNSNGYNIGIFTSGSDWLEILGSEKAYSGNLTQYPLWYVNPNDIANFTDYSSISIGDWKSAQMKQYSTGYLCDEQVAYDYI